MRLLVGTNFDDGLVEAVKKFPVEWFYGSPSVTITGHGRSPSVIGSIDRDRFASHVRKARGAGIKFLYTMNALSLLGREYEPGFVGKVLGEVSWALDVGVSGFIVATPILVEAIKKEHPEAEVVVSSFSLARGLREVEFYLDMGADVITVPEDANRDFKFLEEAARTARARGAELELILNNSCLYGCPYRLAHECLVSAVSSENSRVEILFDYPIVLCAAEVLKDPAAVIRMRWIRPEDLHYYEELGIDRFKISSRGRKTDWIVRAVKAYSERRYDGNLLDILTWQQGAVPRVLKQVGGPEGFEPLLEFRVDNGAFPRRWLDFFKNVDCDVTSCSGCRYCDKIAEATITINGKKLSEYRPRKPELPPTTIPKLAKNPKL